MNSSLYGLSEQNSSRSDDALWGKNQFNSTFPVALCLFMRDKGYDPVTVQLLDGSITTNDHVWTMSDIVGAEEERTYYEFEAAFIPFSGYCRDSVDKIDLVINIDSQPVRPLGN